MKRKFIIWGFCALWLTSLVPLWEAKASRRERLRVNLVDTLGELAESDRINLPARIGGTVSVGALQSFLRSPELRGLSDRDLEVVNAAVRVVRDRRPMTWRQRAVAATEAAFAVTWKRVDDTIGALFRSAPDID